MKKLYTLALASIVALSAAAVRPVQPTEGMRFPTKATYELNFQDMETLQAPMTVKKHKPFRSRAEEATIADYMGDYDWSYINLLKGNEATGELTFTLIDEATGKIKISGFPMGFEVEAVIDLEKKTVSIANNQYLGRDSDGPVYFYGKQLKIVEEEPAEGEEEGESYISGEDGAIDAPYVVGTIEDDYISFDALIAWALGDPSHENLGWWLLSCANELQKGLNWYTIGQGTIIENLMYPTATRKENTAVTTVEIQACADYENAFRVLNPLKATYSALKINSTSPGMAFDASVASDVVMSVTDSGLSTSDLGELYYANMAMLYMMEGLPTPEEYAATMTVEGTKHTVYFPVKSVLIIPEDPVSDEELFYVQSYPTTVTFNYDPAGLGNVVVEDQNAPVEYFNLQGMRVSNPENGIFIRRQGSSTTKILL